MATPVRRPKGRPTATSGPTEQPKPVIDNPPAPKAPKMPKYKQKVGRVTVSDGKPGQSRKAVQVNQPIEGQTKKKLGGKAVVISKAAFNRQMQAYLAGKRQRPPQKPYMGKRSPGVSYYERGDSGLE